MNNTMRISFLITPDKELDAGEIAHEVIDFLMSRDDIHFVTASVPQKVGG